MLQKEFSTLSFMECNCPVFPKAKAGMRIEMLIYTPKINFFFVKIKKNTTMATPACKAQKPQHAALENTLRLAKID